MKTERNLALIAGISLVIMTITAGFAYGFALKNLIVTGNEASTSFKIAANMSLFYEALVGFSIAAILDVVVAVTLFQLFKGVDKNLSLEMFWSRVVYATVFCLALLYLAMQRIDSFHRVWAFGLLIFGFHLWVLGRLVAKSGVVPKITSVLLEIGAMGYVVQNLGVLLVSNYQNYRAAFENVLAVPMALGELSLAFWLLFRGGKQKQ